MRVVFPSRTVAAVWLTVAVMLALALGWWLSPARGGACQIEVAPDHPAADILVDAAVEGRTDCAVIVGAS